MSMDAKTLEALDASIAKWDRVAENGDANTFITSSACPLCDIFINPLGACAGCPVQRATRQVGCGGSPWDDAYRQQTFLKFVDSTAVDEFRAAAAREALFLRALRPIGGVE
jgi:hypothetical protein